MKKILYVGSLALPDKNAAALRVYAIAHEFANCGVHVDILGINSTFKNTEVTEINSDNPMITFFVKNTKGVRKSILQLVKSRGYTHLICYNTHAILTEYLIHICKQNNISLILDLTEGQLEFKKDTFLRAIDGFVRFNHSYKKIKNYIFISSFFTKRYDGNVIVVPSLRYPIRKEQESYQIQDGEVVRFVYCGNISALTNKERIDNIIEAFHEVFSNNPRYALHIIGPTREDCPFTLPDDKNIHFNGRMPHDACIQFIRESAFSLIVRDSSVKNNAGFPTKLGEAFYCGTIPVITKISDVEGYINDRRDSFLLSNSKVTDLTELFGQISHMPLSKVNEMKESAFLNTSLCGEQFESKLQDFLDTCK